MIGIAGSTNATIDLQKENPTFHLVDLEIIV